MDGPLATPEVLPVDLPLGYLVSSLAQLLETARHKLEHDREAAKVSLATASTILQYEIERHSGGKRSATGGLTGWQIARVRAFIDMNLHRTIHTQDLSAVARRSPAHFSRSFKLTFGEPPHAYVIQRRLEKVHPAGGATLRAGANSNHPIMSGRSGKATGGLDRVQAISNSSS